jgi:hypothetical protein
MNSLMEQERRVRVHVFFSVRMRTDFNVIAILKTEGQSHRPKLTKEIGSLI